MRVRCFDKTPKVEEDYKIKSKEKKMIYHHQKAKNLFWVNKKSTLIGLMYWITGGLLVILWILNKLLN